MSKIPQGDWIAIAARYANGESITRIAQSYGCTPPAIHYILKRAKQRPATILPVAPAALAAGPPGPPPRPAVPRPEGNPLPIESRAAIAAGLDRDLHSRAEAAIAAFRSSFDAAMAEGSPHARQELRQAAADLMRVAARTTIVLDRLSAAAERRSGAAPDYPRSAHLRSWA